MLGKQIRFDLSILRSNPIKYFIFVIQIALVCLISLYTYNNQVMVFMAIELIIIMIMILFMVNISTVFEKLSLEFTVKKLVFYPTTKVTNLISKAILLLMFVVVQIVLNCLAVYIGTLVRGNEFNSQALNLLNIWTLVAGIFCFVTIWGLYNIGAVFVMSCLCTPIFFIVFSGPEFLKLDIFDIVVLISLFIFDLVVNVLKYVKS